MFSLECIFGVKALMFWATLYKFSQASAQLAVQSIYTLLVRLYDRSEYTNNVTEFSSRSLYFQETAATVDVEIIV